MASASSAVPAPSADLTLAEMRAVLAPRIAAEAAFDGWSMAAVDSAAAVLGITPASARLAFAGGAMDIIAAWIAGIDDAMAQALPQASLAALPVRERIRRLIMFRLEATAQTREALRRALAIMAMPQNLAQTAKLGWHSADVMWRLAGDVATDYNHYSKRAILGAIYAASLAVFVDDQSEGQADTAAFVNRRIDGVMQFEKAKARLLQGGDAHFSPARFLGRLRYPAR